MLCVGVALNRKEERNSRVVPPFPESPRCLRPFQNCGLENSMDYIASDMSDTLDTSDSVYIRLDTSVSVRHD